MIFNYPYFVRTYWQNLQPEEAQAQKEAALKFRDFLLTASAQDKLATFGLEKASAAQPNPLAKVDEAILRALQFCWQ